MCREVGAPCKTKSDQVCGFSTFHVPCQHPHIRLILPHHATVLPDRRVSVERGLNSLPPLPCSLYVMTSHHTTFLYLITAMLVSSHLHTPGYFTWPQPFPFPLISARLPALPDRAPSSSVDIRSRWSTGRSCPPCSSSCSPPPTPPGWGSSRSSPNARPSAWRAAVAWWRWRCRASWGTARSRVREGWTVAGAGAGAGAGAASCRSRAAAAAAGCGGGVGGGVQRRGAR